MAAQTLDASTIAQLLAKQKSRGDYGVALKEFLDSGEAGIEVSLSDGIFTGKAGKMVQTGLNNAKKKVNENGKLVFEGAENVKVIATKDDDGTEHVYLINTAVGAE